MTMITINTHEQITRDEDQQTLDNMSEQPETRLTDEQVASALLQYLISGGRENA